MNALELRKLSTFLTSFGSMVQKGKFSAGIEHLVSVLYSVDLPTLGIPTIPTCVGVDVRAVQALTLQEGLQENVLILPTLDLVRSHKRLASKCILYRQSADRPVCRKIRTRQRSTAQMFATQASPAFSRNHKVIDANDMLAFLLEHLQAVGEAAEGPWTHLLFRDLLLGRHS